MFTDSAPGVVMIGGVNVDIGGRPHHPLISRDSNPGHIWTSLGGVGHNIAHNLRQLDVPVTFLTAFGDDDHGARVERGCAVAGIDLRHALRVRGGATSVYLYINQFDGDLALAVSDMEICREISPAFLEQHLALLQTAPVVAVDGNLSEEAIRYIAAHSSAPVFADPVSVSKADRFRSVLSRIHTLKPNRLEAEALTGIPVSDPESAHRAARALLDAGLQRVFLSLGTDGVLAADRTGQVLVPCFPAQVRNTTGAGDAFMAGLIWAFLQGLSLAGSAAAASAAASLAVESEETINPLLSASALRARMDPTSAFFQQL